MSLKAQVARGLKWQAIEIAGRQVLSLVVFTTLARLLDPSDFGLVGLVVVYLAFVTMFIDQGIGTALIQREQLEDDHLNAAFWFSLGFGLLLCLTTLVLAGFVAKFFDEPLLASLLRWSSLALVFNATAAVHGAIFIRAMDFRKMAVRAIVANLAGGAVGVAMALGGYGVWALIGQQLVASLAGTCFIWAASTWRPRLTFSFTHLRELMSVSSSVFGTSLLWFFSSRTDQMVVGKVLGATSLGQYAVATRLSDLAKTTIYQPLGAVALPALSRLQGDRKRLHSAIKRGMEVNALISFPCLIGLSVVASDLVPLLLGPQWKPAGQLLTVLAIYVLVNGLQGISHYAIVATGHAKDVLVIGIAHAIATVIACIVGVRYGVLFVPLALLLNELVFNSIRAYFLKIRTGIGPVEYYRPCLGPVIASLVMVASLITVDWSMPLGMSAYLRMLVQVIAGVGSYVAVVAIVARPALRRLWSVVQAAISSRGGVVLPSQIV